MSILLRRFRLSDNGSEGTIIIRQCSAKDYPLKSIITFILSLFNDTDKVTSIYNDLDSLLDWFHDKR